MLKKTLGRSQAMSRSAAKLISPESDTLLAKQLEDDKDEILTPRRVGP
jgi:hypothetical protein